MSERGFLQFFYEMYIIIAPKLKTKVGTIDVGPLHRHFFDACALQHGDVRATVAGVR